MLESEMVNLRGNTSAPWKLDYYVQYFDISTDTAINRILKAAWPFRGKNFLESDPESDLYVPIWNFITLIIMMSISSGIINSGKKTTENIINCFFSFGIYAGLSSVLLYFYLKINGAALGIFTLLSIYGYSLILYTPMAILYLLPFKIFRLILLFGTAIMSLYFLEKTLGKIGDKHLKVNSTWVMILDVCIQLSLLYSISFNIL